jgi:chloramphenicol-sensitive protein RarD
VAVEDQEKTEKTDNLTGVTIAIGSSVFWGILTIYWKLLDGVPSSEILAHRIFWAFVFVLLLLAWKGRSRELTRIIKDRKTRNWVVCGAVLISVNWFLFIWAVTGGKIVETSLGYYMNPLFTVLWGCVFMRERLGRWQVVALLLAAAGVMMLALEYGEIPWISLSIAVIFSLYGFVKKKVSLDSIASLTIETMLVTPLAILYIIYIQAAGNGHLGTGSWRLSLLLILSGAITAVPLLLFAEGAKRVSLSTLGFAQYISPTMQLFIGVGLYHEPFSHMHFLSFCLIWSAIIIYTVASMRYTRSLRSRGVG